MHGDARASAALEDRTGEPEGPISGLAIFDIFAVSLMEKSLDVWVGRCKAHTATDPTI
jgi:hypothetical protein